MKRIKTLLEHKTHDCIIYLEEETHIKDGNRYATHAGTSLNDKFWGHYNMSYIEALKDFVNRIERGY